MEIQLNRSQYDKLLKLVSHCGDQLGSEKSNVSLIVIQGRGNKKSHVLGSKI